MMVWTTEKPKAVGHYFRRNPVISGEYWITYVNEEELKIIDSRYPEGEWAGPIEPPK
jgi:hypothetical protein